MDLAVKRAEANEYQKRWWAKNRERLKSDPAWVARKNEINRAYMSRARVGRVRKYDAGSYLMRSLRKYGLTLDQYHGMQERQDFACALCERVKPLQIDHCHDTGLVRGLLCRDCNLGLGKFRDRALVLDRAANYVSRLAWV